MNRILIVDDEERIRNLIRKYAEFQGYEVAEASDGLEAVEVCRMRDFDVIVMDIMMPELDGFSACKEIRKVRDTPVIMLSARGEEYDKLYGFELGIDDYVVKPFSPRELMARVQAVTERYRKKTDDPDRDLFILEGLTVDFTSRTVIVDGRRIDMTPKEYDLFFYLVRNRNIALTREKILTEVWGYDFFGDERTLDTHIKLLRNSLGRYRKFIITLRGVGYRFEA
ncbi:response regulator transcription factor [Eubacteriales bacterium mix99]